MLNDICVKVVSVKV